MLKNHAAGERFKPSASECNAWTEGAQFARANRGSLAEPPQGILRHSGVVLVKNIGAVEIPRFGFGILANPLFVADPDDEESSNEFADGGFNFNITEVNDSYEWFDYNIPYKHVVCVLDTSIYGGGLVPAVFDGYCKFKLETTSTNPTTARPRQSGIAIAGPDEGVGPIQIVTVSIDGGDGWAWALGRLGGQRRTGTMLGELLTTLTGNETADVSIGEGYDSEVTAYNHMNLDGDIGESVYVSWIENMNQWGISGRPC